MAWGERKVGFRWVLEHDLHCNGEAWHFFTPTGHLAGTVWENGTWHTWDETGTGGENGVEDGDVERAKLEVSAAILRQGWYTFQPRGRNMRP